MDWLVIIVMGALLGELTSFVAMELDLPRFLCTGIGIFGAVIGGVLVRVAEVNPPSEMSFYFTALIMSIGFLAGGLLAFWLTHRPEDSDESRNMHS